MFAGEQANLYEYVGSDPINFVDPDGTNPLIGAAIGGGVDLGIQLIGNGGRLDCVNWWQVGGSAALGAVGGGIFRGAAGVRTPYGLAVQEATPAAQAALGQARAGATMFRQGAFGVQETAGARFWSLSNPAATPGFAGQLGMPGGAAPVNWIMGGTLRPGATAVTRAAPGLGTNAGGAIEVVVQPGSVGGLWFHMP